MPSPRQSPQDPRLSGVPAQGTNRADALGVVSAKSLGREIADFHVKGLSSRRYRDLTTEKYLLHLDGEGDAQWADIFKGERIVIPRRRSSAPRVQENILRPIIANAVAYHTTMPFEFIVENKQGREARERALVDQAWCNHVATEQRWNAVFAEAMTMAMPAGMCPVHAFWRDDVSEDAFQPVYLADYQGFLPSPGFIDSFAGNPLDTVFSSYATVSSYHTVTYGRVLPAKMVRHAFQHLPEAAKLEGTKRLPSSAIFQRVARRWVQSNINVHGSATIQAGEDAEELIALIYREIAPGCDSEWPNGRLTIIAMNGSASTDRQDSYGAGSAGEPVVLHDDELPGGGFSFVPVYSMARYDDVLGKPFMADLDDLQVQLNIGLSHRKDYIRRSVRPPLVEAGMISDDSAVYEDDARLEIDPMTQVKPYFLELPSRQIQILTEDIAETREAMFRIGGWQAASRGEANAGDPASKVVALASYDDHIHGPTNARFRESVEAHARHAWKLMKQYGDVPWLIEATGDDLAHMAELHIDRTKLSERAPLFKLVSGFGSTPEARAQQIVNLLTTVDALGEPMLTTPAAQKMWPDPSIFIHSKNSAETVRNRRPKKINAKIREMAEQFRAETGFEQTGMSDPWVVQAGQLLVQEIDAEFPVLMDDDIPQHIEALSEITQDETDDPLARRIAMFRQDQYYQWLAQQQMAGAPPPQGDPKAQPGQTGGGPAQPGLQPGGTTTSQSLASASDQVAGLTKQAAQGG